MTGSQAGRATILLLLGASAALPMQPSYDRVFYIAMTTSDMSEAGLDAMWTALAPQGDGPYARLGLLAGNSYLADASPDRGWKLYPDPVAVLDTWVFALARRRNFPIIFRLGGGPWMDPKGASRPNGYSVLKTWRRNLMWFDDHRLHGDLPAEADSITVWGPDDIQKRLAHILALRLNLSRYNLEVQTLKRGLCRQSAVLAAEFYKRFPHLLAGVTIDGETETDPDRAGHIQDYNPWSILEFRDWATGRGEYAQGKTWGAQAYVESARYRDDATPGSDEGRDGHTFNGDFGTDFATWNLRFTTGAEFEAIRAGISRGFTLTVKDAGGFDPPRAYRHLGPGNDFPAHLAAPSGPDRFLKLWNYFRAFQIRNEYDAGMKDAVDAGIPPDLVFNHVIPGSVSWYPLTAGERSYRGGLAPWLGTNSVGGGIGMSYYGLSDSMPAFVRAMGARSWSWVEMPGNRLFPMPITASRIDSYRKGGMRSMIPLIWGSAGEELRGQPGEKAVKDFLAMHGNEPWPGRGHRLATPELTGYTWAFPPRDPDIAAFNVPGASTASGRLDATVPGGFTAVLSLDQDIRGAPVRLAADEMGELKVRLDARNPGTLRFFWKGGELPSVPVQAGMQVLTLKPAGSPAWTGDVTGIGIRLEFASATPISLYAVQIHRTSGGTASGIRIRRGGDSPPPLYPGLPGYRWFHPDGRLLPEGKRTAPTFRLP